MSVTPREASTLSLLSAMEAAYAQPSAEQHQGIHSYLHSQATLTKYSDQLNGISACSLNTLKKSCSVIPGGFNALDMARRRALAALENNIGAPQPDDSGSKRILQLRVKSLKEQLQASTEDLLLLHRLLERALRHGRQYATDSRDASLIERCAQDQKEIRDMLSLRQIFPSHLHVVDESK